MISVHLRLEIQGQADRKFKFQTVREGWHTYNFSAAIDSFR